MYRVSIRSQVVRILLQELSAARKGGTVGVDCAYMMRLLKGEGQRCVDFFINAFVTLFEAQPAWFSSNRNSRNLRCASYFLTAHGNYNLAFPTSPFLRLHFWPVHQDVVP